MVVTSYYIKKSVYKIKRKNGIYICNIQTKRDRYLIDLHCIMREHTESRSETRNTSNEKNKE